MAAFYYTNQKQESNLLEYVPKNFVIKTLLFPETESQVTLNFYQELNLI